MPVDRPLATLLVAVLVGALLNLGCATSGHVVSPNVAPAILDAAFTALANRGASRPLTELLLYGGPDDRIYLGRLCFWTSTSDCVDDPHGRFGRTSANGILNRSGRFGHPESNYSPCNRRALSPPVVVTSNGVSFGRLTINTDLPDAVQVQSLRTWIDTACAGGDGQTRNLRIQTLHSDY
jgi:hypothetical protein